MSKAGKRGAAAPLDWSLLMGFRLLGGEHLHLGLWRRGEAQTLENMRAAMERFSRRVVSYVPRGAALVLDAGCGVGGNARRLARAGRRVDCVSPERYHRQEFLRRPVPGVSFSLSRFEDFKPRGKYDLVLMSESFGYMDPAAALAKARAALREGGWLLIANPLTPGQQRGIAGFGFVCVREEDISEAVKPSFEVLRSAFERYYDPFASFFWEAAAAAAPRLRAGLERKLRSSLDPLTLRMLSGQGASVFGSGYGLPEGARYKICLYRKNG